MRLECIVVVVWSAPANIYSNARHTIYHQKHTHFFKENNSKECAAFTEGSITPYKSQEIPVRNQKSHTPKQEIPLKNEKYRTLNVELIYPSIMGS